MYGEPIGILLSKQVWKQIKNNKYLNKVNLYQYVKKGEELGIETAFFTINNVLDNNRTVEAYRIENESNLKEGTINIPSIIYNPTKLFRKKNIKRLRQLSQHPEIQVINEHHHINEQSLYELVKSKSELQAYLDNGMKKFVTPFTIHLLAQKNISHKWNIPAIYAKDLDGTLYTLDEMGLLSISRKIEKEQTIYRISKMVLEAIHFYYPGIYEVGLQFSLNE